MWTVAPGTDPPSDPAPYKTRVVVYRPIDPKKFNGTVIVEWLNVSGQVDADPDWTQTHNELIRDGFAWVGVSAQARGSEPAQVSRDTTVLLRRVRLPAIRPATGRSSHPGDSYSYDIFSQAGQAIRDQLGADPRRAHTEEAHRGR